MESAPQTKTENIEIENVACVLTAEPCPPFAGGYRYSIVTRDLKPQIRAYYYGSRDLAIRMMSARLSR